MYTLLSGFQPFNTPDIRTTYKKIRNCVYSFPDDVSISDEAKYMI